MRDPEQLTERALRTRKALLAGARKVFEADGFLNARVTDITRRARVAHGTFYVYFDSKESILSEVVRQAHQELLRPMDIGSEDPLPMIEEINRHYLSVYRDNARLLVAWEKVALINDEFEALQRELRNGYAQWSKLGIVALQRSGQADPELDPDVTARALSAMVNQFCYEWFSQDLDYDFDVAVKHITRLATNAIQLKTRR